MHEFGGHIAYDLNILVIDLLLKVIQASFDDVTIELSGNE